MENLNAFAKDLLLTNYKDLVFADDVENLKCIRCDKVLIYNFKTNCGHHVCKTCKSRLMLNKWKCPKCKTVITSVNENDIEVEIKINQLRVHCLNKKYGCDEILIAPELLLHLCHCKHTRENSLPLDYAGPRDVSLLIDKIGELTNQVRQNQEQFNQLTIKVEQNQEKIEIQSKQIIQLLENHDSKKRRQNHNFNEGENNDDDENTMAKSKDKQTFNILLLGEGGAGKSTLINSFANYSAYATFQEALDGEEICLIPTKFCLYDENLKEMIVNAGTQEDKNEDMAQGQSGTLSCKSYVFNLSKKLAIRFIDTSGFADTKGRGHDEENLEDILDYVVQFQKIHAFAIVMQANQTNETKQMKDFLYQIFRRLGKDALKNVIFIFTHGRKPQNSLHLTKSVFDELSQRFDLPNIVKLEKKNIFCFENEPFTELLVIKKGYKTANESEMEKNESDWTHSTKDFERLLKTVFEITPFPVNLALSGQNAIEYIRSVSAITGIILSNIDNNLNRKFPTITKIGITPQENAISMCLSHKKCNYTKGEVEKNFKIFGRNVCCDGCHLNFGWRSCKQMHFITAKCKKCNCNLKKHVFFFYNVSLHDVELSAKDATKYLNNLREEKALILNGLYEIINGIDIKDKKASYSGEAFDEDNPYSFSKHLYWLSWKGNPADNISKIKNQLESLSIYGSIIEEACQTNEKNNKELKRKRDKKVKNINKVFKLKT